MFLSCTYCLRQNSSMSGECCTSNFCLSCRSTARASASMWWWWTCKTSLATHGSIRALRWKSTSERLRTVTADRSDASSSYVYRIWYFTVLRYSLTHVLISLTANRTPVLLATSLWSRSEVLKYYTNINFRENFLQARSSSSGYFVSDISNIRRKEYLRITLYSDPYWTAHRSLWRELMRPLMRG